MLNFLETYDCDGSGTADLTKRPFVSGLTRYVTPYEDGSYGHLSHGQGTIATELLITPSGDGITTVTVVFVSEYNIVIKIMKESHSQASQHTIYHE